MPLRRIIDLNATACSRFRVKAAELPDENHVEGGLRLASLLDHLSELGPVGDAAALGLVHVLAGDGVAVGLGVVFDRPQLR